MSGTVLGIDSRIAYTVFVALVAMQRLWELQISKRHLRTLRAEGAFEVGAGHYPWMVALHTSFLISCVAEVWFMDRPWRPAVAAVSMMVLAAAAGLRWWTLSTLGGRWTTRVMVVPGEELVTGGPFRYLRHPNYLAVIMEIAAIPMVHCAWLTAVVFSAADLLLLRVRTQVEESALRTATGCDPAVEGSTR
jgi:methyltransferase